MVERGGVTIVSRPPPLSSLYEWYHLDHWNILIKNHYVLLCITPLTHTILPLLYPAFNISFLSFFSLLSPPLPPSPPPCPANADLGLHTNIFPTIVEHEFISITKDCICIFNILFFFLFADPPVWPPRGSLFRRLPPTLSCPGNMWIGRRGIFSDVMFHSEAQYENHDSKVTVNHFITSPLNVFRLFLGGIVYVLQK